MMKKNDNAKIKLEKVEMEEIQKVETSILHEVAQFCEKENIRYFFIYGTLLGAVRHKGFIPWDDDVDIALPRPDYDRFLKLCKENGDKVRKYKIFNLNTCTNYPNNITRVCDTDSVIEKAKKAENCGMGLFIDVYPLDGLGNDLSEAKDIMKKSKIAGARISQVIDFDKDKIRELLRRGQFLVALKWKLKHIIGLKHYLKQSEKFKYKYEYENSKYVGISTWTFFNMPNELFPRDAFDNFQLMEFEEHKYRIPQNYDVVLKQLYGDYMTPPPPEKRIPHHEYIAYKKVKNG